MKKNRKFMALFIGILTIFGILLPSTAALAAGDNPPAPLLQVTDTPTPTATITVTLTPTPTMIAPQQPQWWSANVDWTGSGEASYSGGSVYINVSACGPDAMIAAVYSTFSGFDNQYARWREIFNGSNSGLMTGNNSYPTAYRNSNINWTIEDRANLYGFGTYTVQGIYSYTTANGEGAQMVLSRTDYMSYQGTGGYAKITEGAQIWCYGLKQNAIQSEDNLLGDGDMEQYPSSTFWTGYTNIGPPTALNPFDQAFGRLRNDGLSVIDQLFYNNLLAACNNGFHAVGPYLGPGQFGFDPFPYVTQPWGESINQQFYWPGGTLFWKIRARGRIPQVTDILSSTDKTSHAYAWLMDMDGATNTVLLDQTALTDQWALFTGAITDLPAGNYSLMLDHGIRESYGGGLESVYYDDVSVGSTIRSSVCDYDTEGNFVPYTTRTPTVTPYVTPVTGTPSPLGINVVNCNFENGISGWQKNTSGSISNEWPLTLNNVIGGPVGPNFAMMEWNVEDDILGQIYQEVRIPRGGTLFYQFYYIGGRNDSYMKNKDTGEVVPLFFNATNQMGWEMTSGAVPISVGNWYLTLTLRGNTGSGFVYTPKGAYDGIVLSLDGIVANGCYGQSTPTPITGFPPFMTRTPTVTGTPPTRTPTITSAYTRTPTPTPLGWSGTPSPSNGACGRPQDWFSVGGWMDYYWCKYMDYTSFKPEHLATLQAMPNRIYKKEPFAMASEVQSSYDKAVSIFKFFNWKVAPGYKLQSDPMISNPAGDAMADTNESADTLEGFTTFGLPADSPYLGGQVTFGSEGLADIPEYNARLTKCVSQLQSRYGVQLASGICFSMDTASRKGVIPWLELFMNGSVLVGFLSYLYGLVKKFLRWQL